MRKDNGWISWQRIDKGVQEDFSEIEKELDVIINEDVKEYYNSF